ncbi:hypothetical protein [Pectobacterium parmentieri]|uniref:hypothetical protein n=1 Tax=Pectobacterium parmentieri TaxID=1905730 RepID=UPI000EB02E0D|nr:hypothetical protein [Pectobacterium parmentieri]AYH04839.1 hypothetical protein C5E25_05365 [Pectobacterium parmentieri]AYH22362.1 hypothetical protein C5E21_05345 [Pectobacterium parmentieri]MBN3178782.1 hypothetical protein [Pectobacterium parmentieri]QRN31010.1 hypothetical protein IG623_05295 [Pectobacterium parmentieri]
MSNDVFGFIYPSPKGDDYKKLIDYISSIDIGVFRIGKEELFNIPHEMIPDGDIFSFLIGDRPDYPNATYLIDYCEYDPDSSVRGFPSNPKDRLNILLDVISAIFLITNPEKMLVALTDSSQIERIERINHSDIYNVISGDFEIHQGPPDTLYEIVW